MELAVGGPGQSRSSLAPEAANHHPAGGGYDICGIHPMRTYFGAIFAVSGISGGGGSLGRDAATFRRSLPDG